LFAGILSSQLLRDIVDEFGTADSYLGTKGFMKVDFKKFAVAFDDIQLPDVPPRENKLLGIPGVTELRVFAQSRRLDMTDAFEEYSDVGTRDFNLGIMKKDRFTSTLGILFAGRLSVDMLNAFSTLYGTGVRSGDGSYEKVKWQDFAEDFDNIPLPQDAHTHFTVPTALGATAVGAAAVHERPPPQEPLDPSRPYRIPGYSGVVPGRGGLDHVGQSFTELTTSAYTAGRELAATTPKHPDWTTAWHHRPRYALSNFAIGGDCVEKAKYMPPHERAQAEATAKQLSTGKVVAQAPFGVDPMLRTNYTTETALRQQGSRSSYTRM